VGRIRPVRRSGFWTLDGVHRTPENGERRGVPSASLGTGSGVAGGERAAGEEHILRGRARQHLGNSFSFGTRMKLPLNPHPLKHQMPKDAAPTVPNLNYRPPAFWVRRFNWFTLNLGGS